MPCVMTAMKHMTTMTTTRCGVQADRSLMISLTYIIGFMAVIGVALYVSYKQGHAV